MKITPVKSSRTPDYPTLREFSEHPELLSKNVPFRWIKNKYVATSLAAFILCGTPKDSDNIKAKTSIVFDESMKNKAKDEVKTEKKDSVKIAPIFAHGEGFGATGCIVSSPPVFISEEEAKTIIFNALKKESIEFDSIYSPMFKFKIHPIAISCFNEDTNKTKKILKKVKLKMDGYNKRYNLAIQYVSDHDYVQFKSNYWNKASAQCHETKKTAYLLREQLLLKSETNAVIFYDPLILIDSDKKYALNISDKDALEAAKKEAKQLLLAQVEDFIKWIKEEGLLNK